MEQFFTSILDLFETVINFIITFFSGILQFLSMIPGIFLFMTESVGYLPAFVAPFFVLGVTTLVILAIISIF